MEFKHMRWRIAMVFGVLIFAGGFLGTSVGVMYLVNPGSINTVEEDMSAGVNLSLFCGIFCLLPGIIIIAFAWREKRAEEKLEELANYVRQHRRIKIQDLAQKIGKNPFETEKMLAKCIEYDFLRGYVDRHTGEFFTEMALWQEKQTRYGFDCEKCGANNPKVLLPGEVAKCAYCDALNSGREGPGQSGGPPPSPPPYQGPPPGGYPPPPPSPPRAAQYTDYPPPPPPGHY